MSKELEKAKSKLAKEEDAMNESDTQKEIKILETQAQILKLLSPLSIRKRRIIMELLRVLFSEE